MHSTLNASRVWIDEEFCRIAAMAFRRRPGSVQPESILLAGLKARKVAVPSIRCHLGKVISDFAPAIIEEAKFDSFRNAGEQGEVNAGPVVRWA